ncbi:MAG: SMC-Scp complex subunit ScpB [bacterium]|nr:SMC-Scp complex subunit ScpB [bacterium]
MLNLENKIEAMLFFKNEPVSVVELGKWLGEKPDVVRKALAKLGDSYLGRGVVIISDGEFASLGTHPDASKLIESLEKEELSRELGRASLETLAIVLYKGPISRREIDHIRGVNSSFILRALLIRGLIERAESMEKSYSYKATIKLLEYLGITRPQDLPEYENAFNKIAEFMKTTPNE